MSQLSADNFETEMIGHVSEQRTARTPKNVPERTREHVRGNVPGHKKETQGI